MAWGALALAAALVVIAGGAIARGDWAAIRKGRGAAIERVWVILPLGFLALLLVLAARAAA